MVPNLKQHVFFIILDRIDFNINQIPGILHCLIDNLATEKKLFQKSVNSWKLPGRGSKYRSGFESLNHPFISSRVELRGVNFQGIQFLTKLERTSILDFWNSFS